MNLETQKHKALGTIPAKFIGKFASVRTVLIFVSVCMLLFGVFYGVRKYTSPKPPLIQVEGLDPAIVRVLTQHYDAVRNQPRSGETWGKLGTALLAYEFKQEAQTCFREAERRASQDPRWPYFFGLSLFPEATEEGLSKLRRAVTLHADKDSSARNRLATILSELGQYAEAAEHFHAVLKRWPDDPTAVLGMGKIHFAQGELQESLEFLRRASNNRHTAKTAQQMLITLHTRMGAPKAAELARQRFEEMPDDAGVPDAFVDEASSVRTGRKAWLDHATQLYRQGRIADALPLVERTVKFYPESGDAWILMARLRMQRKQYAEAEDAWKKAIERLPKAVEAHTQLGVTQMHLSNMDSAIRNFRRAIELKPNLSEAYHNLGLSYNALKQLEKAVESFREAIRIRPGFVDSYLGLADVLARTGDRDGAKEVLEQGLQLNPNDTRALQLKQRHGL